MPHQPSTSLPDRRSVPSRSAESLRPALTPLPAVMAARLTEIRTALSQRAPGRWLISASVALTADERDWLVEEFLPRREAEMAPCSSDDLYARLERFSFGFAQLRSQDPVAVQGTILNWAEALEEQPFIAVDHACRGWNARRFDWQRSGFVPNPDELARAAAECAEALNADVFDIRRALGARAEPAEPPCALPAPGRPITVGDAIAEYRAAAARAWVDLGDGDVRLRPRRETPAEYLADLATRTARRLTRESEETRRREFEDGVGDREREGVR